MDVLLFFDTWLVHLSVLLFFDAWLVHLSVLLFLVSLVGCVLRFWLFLDTSNTHFFICFQLTMP